MTFGNSYAGKTFLTITRANEINDMIVSRYGAIEETGASWNQVSVATMAELELAVLAATLLDTRITITGTNYTDTATLAGNGAKVIVRSATPLATTLRGQITIAGNNIHLRELTFAAGVDTGVLGSAVYVTGNDCKVMRSDIIDIDVNQTGNYDWIRLSKVALRTEIGYNLFRNKTTEIQYRQVITQTVADDTPEPYETHVHHNHFQNIAGASANSELYIVYGVKSLIDDSAEYAPSCVPNNIVFEFNLVDNVQSDKIVDMKTNGVTARFNTITGGSSGIMVIRHANNCSIHHNVATVNDGTVFYTSMAGANNSIYNNVLVAKDNAGAAGIEIHSGTNLEHDTVGYLSHQLVDNAFIAFNTIYGSGLNSNGIIVGTCNDSDGGQDWAYPPQNSTIAHNIMVGNGKSMFTGHRAYTEMNGMIYDNNRYADGVTLTAGTGLNDYGDGSMVALLGTKLTYASMNLADYFTNGVLLPTSGSSILGLGTNSYPTITDDVNLTTRPTAQAVGAVEMYDALSTQNVILTATDTGYAA
jgi:hypothetical protein